MIVKSNMSIDMYDLDLQLICLIVLIAIVDNMRGKAWEFEYRGMVCLIIFLVKLE